MTMLGTYELVACKEERSESSVPVLSRSVARTSEAFPSRQAASDKYIFSRSTVPRFGEASCFLMCIYRDCPVFAFASDVHSVVGGLTSRHAPVAHITLPVSPFPCRVAIGPLPLHSSSLHHNATRPGPWRRLLTARSLQSMDVRIYHMLIQGPGHAFIYPISTFPHSRNGQSGSEAPVDLDARSTSMTCPSSVVYASIERARL